MSSNEVLRLSRKLEANEREREMLMRKSEILSSFIAEDEDQIEREKNQAEEIAKEFRLTSSEVDVFETRTSKASSELRQEQERLNVGERDKLLKSKVNGYFERKAELLKVLQEFDTLATELASNRSILSKVVNDVQDTISKDQDMVLLQQEQLNSVSSSANSSYKLNQRKQYKDNIDHLELLLIEAERSLKTIISTRQNTYHSMHLMVNGIESLVQQKINNNALLSEGANQYAERSDALEREIAISKNNLDSLIILRNDILDRCKLENQQIERLKSTRSDLLSEIVVIKNSNVNLDRKRSLQKDVIASMKTELDDGTTQLLDSSQLLLKSKSTLKISRVETEKAKHNQDVLKKAEELKTKLNEERKSLKAIEKKILPINSEIDEKLLKISDFQQSIENDDKLLFEAKRDLVQAKFQMQEKNSLLQEESSLVQSIQDTLLMKPTDAEFARNQDYIVQLTEKREEVVKSINETELQISSLSSSILAIGKEIDNMTKSKDKRNRRTSLEQAKSKIIRQHQRTLDRLKEELNKSEESLLGTINAGMATFEKIENALVEELDNITANVEMVEQEVSSATKLSKAKNTINDESRSVPSTEIDSQLLVESSWEDLLSVPATRLASTKRTVSKGKDKEKSYNQIVSSSKPQKRLFGTTLDPNKQFREGEKDSKKISQPSARMRFSSSQTAK